MNDEKSLRDLYLYDNCGCKEHSKIIKSTRIKETCTINYGYDNCMKSPLIQEKTKNTIMMIYGVSFIGSSKKIRDKISKTVKKKYNVDHVGQIPTAIEKGQNTCLLRYGNKYYIHSEQGKLKVKDTYMKQYGLPCNLQVEEVKQMIIQTNLLKYGVPFPMQNPIVAQLQQEHSYKSKKFIYPSGRIDSVQGYEPFALADIIHSEIDENDIITNRTKVPTIWWNDNNNKNHRYYVDIFIPSKNKCIEVKSTWTFNLNNDIVLLKQQAVKDAGYKCEIWVYDAKKVLIEKYT